MQSSITALCKGTAWDTWIPLENCWRGKLVPAYPGLYRIHLVDEECRKPAYIGQSVNLRERLGMLKHVYGDSSPRHAPHFAGPQLWTWRRSMPETHFEVSVAPFPTVSKPLRLGLECLAIALCQQEYHFSPLVNFGRTHDEWWKLWDSSPEDLAAEVEPTGPLDGNPHALSWCGLNWVPWIDRGSALLPKGRSGLYRLRVPGENPFLYIGQGEIADRVAAHRSISSLECSWVEGSWTSHRRLELVSTMVGAHLLSLSALPLLQFEKNSPLGGPADSSAAA
jgi:hypothetical protein